MGDFYLFGAMLFHIFHQQSAMTLFGSIFTAKETRAIERLDSVFAQNVPIREQFGVYSFIFFPIHFLLMPLVK